MRQFFKYNKWQIFFSACLPVQILVVQLLSTNPAWVEERYTQNFYKKLSYFLRVFFGNIPFPIGQFLFYSLILFLVVAIGKQVRRLVLKKINWQQFGIQSFWGVLSFLSIFYFLFTGMWAFNYYRKPVETITGIQSREVTPAELELLCRRLIYLTNSSRNIISSDSTKPLHISLSKKQMLDNATAGFHKAAVYFPEFAYAFPSVKAVYLPQIMSFVGISGIYFPLTGEANVNTHPPAYLLPGTICHEMAHQIGFASEDEANYVSYLVCRLNPDPVFRYSGNYMAMKYAMNRLKKVSPGRFKKLEKLYSTGLQQDLALNRQYWERFQNPIEEFSDFFYDIFLKVNDQEDGIQSYSKVVELLMGEFRKNNLEYK